MTEKPNIPPFQEIPDGLSIAHWFVEDLPNQKYHGADGIDLWRGDDGTYCYLWIEATVDQDLSYFWLLDIRTAPTSAKFGETRDFLLVWWDLNDGVQCEWYNHPIAFLASVQEHRDQLRSGLEWFHNRVMEEVERERPDRPSIDGTVHPKWSERPIDDRGYRD